jgi:hypothetical protein
MLNLFVFFFFKLINILKLWWWVKCNEWIFWRGF